MVDGALSSTDATAFTTRERWWALGLFALALCLRLWVAADFEAHHPQAATPVIDEASYDAWARRIAAGDWLGQGVFFQEPLYSYLLGILYWIGGPSLHAARAAQAVLGAGTAIAVLCLARRLFGRAAGWIAALSFACYRPALWFPTLLLKENLFTFVLVLLALAIVKTRAAHTQKRAWLGWGSVGFLAGLGALLRGNLVPMLPVLVLWPALRAACERRWTARALIACAMVFVGAALVLLPVALRNRAVGGAFVLTTSGAGTNIYGGNNLDNPSGVATEFAWVRTVPEHEADDWRHEAERRSGKSLSPMEVSSFWMHASLQSMREHPLEHAKILGRKLLLTLGAYEVPDNHFLEWDARYVASLRWPWPGFGIVGPLALIGCALLVAGAKSAQRWNIDFGAAIEVLLLAGLYLGTVVLTVTSDRIRYPLVGLLLPFAAFAVVRASVWLWRERRVSLAQFAAGTLVVTASAFVVWTPVIDAQERAKDFDERDYNLAVEILRAKSSLAKAEQIVTELSARRPRDPNLELLQAEIESSRGLALLAMKAQAPFPDAEARAGAQLESALARLEWILERGTPIQHFRADAMTARILQSMGEFAQAARHYARALEFDPEDRDLLRLYGVCLANAAMQSPPGEERARGIEQALGILEPLNSTSSDAELARLIAGIRAAR